jgi:uncharacterized protein (TIGR04255 family)
VRYEKAPILEAVLEFRWSPVKPLDQLRNVLSIPAFEEFEAPKPRKLISASFDLESGSVAQESTQLGFELVLKDGSERVFLEEGMFVFVQSAPYDRWDYFSGRGLTLLESTISALGVSKFERVAVRFVNRIDIPPLGAGNFNVNDYININFNGPWQDDGDIKEFQMRVVKPTLRDGISYALAVATWPSPLEGYHGVVLDIDVFCENSVPVSRPILVDTLAILRNEKNDIFEKWITAKARALFGRVLE